MQRDCVEHFVSGQDAWQLGVVGFLTKVRGISTVVGIAVATMSSVPWWWPRSWRDASVAISPLTTLILVAALCGTCSVIGLFYLRYRTRRSLDIKNQLHAIAHFIRDAYADGVQQIRADDAGELQFRRFVSDLCERSKQYFALLLHDPKIAVAVRLAVRVHRSDGRPNDIVYATIGRSSGLNENRVHTSEPISATEGVAKYLLQDKGSRGVLIYNNIEKATEMSTFKKTKNEEIYPSDVKSLMVAPLNAKVDGDWMMIGMLFLGTHRSAAFRAKEVDSMRFMADISANAIATIIDALTRENRMPQLKVTP